MTETNSSEELVNHIFDVLSENDLNFFLIFQKHDLYNETGQVSQGNFRSLLTSSPFNLEESEVDQLIQEIPKEKNEMVNYKNFFKIAKGIRGKKAVPLSSFPIQFPSFDGDLEIGLAGTDAKSTGIGSNQNKTVRFEAKGKANFPKKSPFDQSPLGLRSNLRNGSGPTNEGGEYNSNWNFFDFRNQFTLTHFDLDHLCLPLLRSERDTKGIPVYLQSILEENNRVLLYNFKGLCSKHLLSLVPVKGEIKSDAHLESRFLEEIGVRPIQMYQSLGLGTFKKIVEVLKAEMTSDEAHLFYHLAHSIMSSPSTKFSYHSLFEFLLVKTSNFSSQIYFRFVDVPK